jgi:hypothetical protein
MSGGRASERNKQYLPSRTQKGDDVCGRMRNRRALFSGAAVQKFGSAVVERDWRRSVGAIM